MTKKEFARLIEEATVDCYTEDECRSGFFVYIQDTIPIPCHATVAGGVVNIARFDQKMTRLLALYERNGKTFGVDVLDVVFPQKTKGVEWIEAYREWCGEREESEDSDD